MASFKLYLDTRKKQANEPAPVVIIVSHKNMTTHIPTGVKCLADEIDLSDGKTNGRVVKGENKSRKSAVIASKKMIVQRCLLELAEQRKLESLSVQDIKKYIMSNGEELPDTSAKFCDKLIEYANRKSNSNTRYHFDYTLKLVSEYADIDKLRFEYISVKWLTDFQNFLTEEKNLSTNTIALVMRRIRSTFNEAIDDELTTNYPFRKFKIKVAATKKRSLNVDELRQVLNYQTIHSKIAFFRDIFALTFYLIGINMADLFTLKKTDLVDGRIYYSRHKTSKPYSIKVEREAMEIIERYKGDKYLLCLAEKYDNPRIVSCNASTYLGAIREGLTLYWARHSWASIAFNDCEISKDDVSLALGHSNGLAVTSIYINPSLKKIDEANRKVIDFVLSNNNKQ